MSLERWLPLVEETPGFLPSGEGVALHRAGVAGGTRGALLEIGSYCGRSTILLGAAAQGAGVPLFTIDHHRGSEEHQPGEGYHDPALFDPARGRVDTLPCLLGTIARAGLEATVAPLVGSSSALAQAWDLPLGLVFIDGGHSEDAVQADLRGWAPHIVVGGLLAIHDVFEDPAEGGRPPFHIYRAAIESRRFVEKEREGSLRVLERVGDRV